MLQVQLIGYLGSDAEVKSANGKEFITFRIANTERWNDQQGQMHESTVWIDCTMNGTPAVRQYLVKGALVYATGSCSLRVYSSPKDKCMKAGMNVNVLRLELLGGKPEPIPAKLINPADGQMVDVQKYYGIAEWAKGTPGKKSVELVDNRGGVYMCDKNGWVTKVVNETQTE